MIGENKQIDRAILMKEMDKLEKLLIVNEIPYERILRYSDGIVWRNQICVPNNDHRRWDAVCQFGTYGSEDGLLEVMGSIVDIIDPDHYDEVVGWLTADEVMKAVCEDGATYNETYH